MKKIIIIIILTIVFFVSIFIGNSLYNNYETTEYEYHEIGENEIRTNNISERAEINTSVLYDSEDGDLMSIDMNYNNDVRLYYKIITNKEDYNKYKSRINLPDNIDFEKDFLIIIANENIRSEEEYDLRIYEVTADETTTHIVMKQKENPSTYNINNVFYALVNKSELRENIDIKIEE